MTMDRILLIHSNPKATDKLTFLLQHSGFQVATALDADQALADIPRTQPDVIGMAEAVAKTNGDEPFMRIRQRCKAPIIILGEHRKEGPGFVSWKQEAMSILRLLCSQGCF